MPEKTQITEVNAAPAIILRRLNNTDIGQPIETDNNQSAIYLGVWENIKAPSGYPLKCRFNIFTTDRDTRFLSLIQKGEPLTDTTSLSRSEALKLLKTYHKEIKRVASLRDIFGHNGILMPNHYQLFKAIQAGIATNNFEEVAKWHIPPRELVDGRDCNGRQIQPHNLLAHKDEGQLKDSFTDAYGSSAQFYWTCTESPENAHRVFDVSLADGKGRWERKGLRCLSSRPVRLEPRLYD